MVVVVVVVYLFTCLSASLKTKLFCETSSIFELDSIQNKAILQDLLNFRSWQHQKRSNSARHPSIMESWVQSWRPCTALYHCVFFSSPCLWSIAPATKKWCQVIQSDSPVTQNHLPKTEDLMLQNATLLKKSAPWPPKGASRGKCIFQEPLQMFRACHHFWTC